MPEIRQLRWPFVLALCVKHIVFIISHLECLILEIRMPHAWLTSHSYLSWNGFILPSCQPVQRGNVTHLSKGKYIQNVMNIKCAVCNADPIANNKDSLSDYQLHAVKILIEFYMKYQNNLNTQSMRFQLTCNICLNDNNNDDNDNNDNI